MRKTSKLPVAALILALLLGLAAPAHAADSLSTTRKKAAAARARRAQLAAKINALKARPPQPHELLSTYYRAADVCLVPSRSESFGLVALEAGACGTPVVAAAVGGLRTLVDHGRTGFLVEHREPALFAAYVREIVANPLLAAGFSANAAERARGYTWPQAAARLRDLYADLTARSLVECR